MADEDKPKPMSIKERMAAFQQAAQKPAATPPRPAAKPANWSWKQKQAEAVTAVAAAPTPSASAEAQAPQVNTRDIPQVDERFDRKTGMSASDAQESTKGQSLKERMAALQKGFATPEPVPRPPLSEKPRVWKRPVAPASTDDSDEVPAPPLPISLQPAEPPSREPENPVEGDPSPPPGGEATESASVPEGEEEEVDEEEKERQRRAAIAVRMAKLGGARVGMGPPIFSRPAVKSPSPSVSAGSAAEDPSRHASIGSLDAPTPAARIPLPSLSSPTSAPHTPTLPVETPSGDKEVKSPPLSVPKRALPPRKKSVQKQTSGESESSFALPSSTTTEGESAHAPVVATLGEVEGEVNFRAQPHTESEALAQISVVDEMAAPDEVVLQSLDIDEETVPAPVPVDTAAVIAESHPIVVEPTTTTTYDTETLGTEESRVPLSSNNLGPISTTKTAEITGPGAEVDLASPATELGRNAMALLADEEGYELDGFVPPPPPPPPLAMVSQEHSIPPALRSQLDEEEPEEDTWEEEVPPVRSSIPPPPPPPLPTRIEHERSETHTPVPPVATRPPVPAGLASAVPTSPPSRAVPVPVRSESPVSPPSRQGSIPERPARRSMPPPPPPPPPVGRNEGDEEEEVEQEEGGTVGEVEERANSARYEEPDEHEGIPQAVTSEPAPPPMAQSSLLKAADEMGQGERDQEHGGGEIHRRQSLAERMARLGGVKLGTPGVPGAREVPKKRYSLPARDTPMAFSSQEPAEGKEESEEAARARRAAIAARLAGMGGMRVGMLPGSNPAPALSHSARSDYEVEVDVEVVSGPEGSSLSDDGVRVEAPEESEIENIEEDEISSPTSPVIVSPPPPVRAAPAFPSLPPGRRPPVPAGLPPLVARKPSGPPPPVPTPPYPGSAVATDYVLVDEPVASVSPNPVKRSSIGPSSARRSLPPLPVPTAPPPPPLATRPRSPPTVDLGASSQWELPNAPTAEPLEMSCSAEPTHSHDDTAYPLPIPPQSPPPIPGHSRPSSMTPIPRPKDNGSKRVYASADDLVTLYNRVGVQVFTRAAALVEYSRKSVIGDGSGPGFVHTVLEQVPAAVILPDTGINDAGQVEYGPTIYVQNGSSVQKRASDIMPGDIVTIRQAKFKGHRGLTGYSTTVDLVVGIVNEFEEKKGKLKIWQAALHANTYPAVESVSYRLDDLKSGTIKIYRVADA